MRKHSDHPLLLFLLFLVEERRKAADPRATVLQPGPKWRPAFFMISRFDLRLERSAVDVIRFLLRHFARERLASKTINSLLAQNGEPELDKE